MEKVFDYAIFGAGVVGSCIFDKLTSLGQSAILLEKNMDVATGQSKANTALVHAGFDAKPNTLKAKLNVLGNQMYEDICMRLGIPFERCGAVVVDKTRDVLDKLLLRGQQNGVKDLEIGSKFEKRLQVWTVGKKCWNSISIFVCHCALRRSGCKWWTSFV